MRKIRARGLARLLAALGALVWEPEAPLVEDGADEEAGGS